MTCYPSHSLSLYLPFSLFVSFSLSLSLSLYCPPSLSLLPSVCLPYSSPFSLSLLFFLTSFLLLSPSRFFFIKVLSPSLPPSLPSFVSLIHLVSSSTQHKTTQHNTTLYIILINQHILVRLPDYLPCRYYELSKRSLPRYKCFDNNASALV